MKRNRIVEQYIREGHRPVLLVVDDQPLNIHALYQIFKDDFQVLMATSGEQALIQIKDQLPDVILLDIVMPGIDGYELCRTLSEDTETEDIPVIFVTAQTEDSVEEKGFAAGAVDFITKPFNPLIVRARVMTHLTIKLQMDLVRNMATVDGLTNLFNRQHFDQSLERNWRLCKREKRPMALLMIDVDHFKRFNDSYGHIAGDKCLQQVSRVLSDSLQRPTDSSFRYGGEEFSCLLPFTDEAGAEICARRILSGVRNLKLEHNDSPTAEIISVSIGISSVVPSSQFTTELLLSRADDALYKSKEGGRDQYTVFSGCYHKQS